MPTLASRVNTEMEKWCEKGKQLLEPYGTNEMEIEDFLLHQFPSNKERKDLKVVSPFQQTP